MGEGRGEGGSWREDGWPFAPQVTAMFPYWSQMATPSDKLIKQSSADEQQNQSQK